jgi:hypothetical protein
MRLVRLILGDPDPRSRQEIEHDIDDELEFHLEQLVAEERALGKPPDAARLEARRRFGSIDHYRKLCLNVNLKERIMLQRINLGLLVLVALGLGFTAWQSWAAQSRTADAVEGLTKQLAEMRAAPATPNAAPAATPSTVTITGEIARSGVYNVPAEGLTLKRLMAAAGWNGKSPVNTVIERMDGAKENTTIAVTWAQLVSPTAPEDPPLRPGDLIIVTQVDRASVARTPAKPDEHGKIADLGFSGRVLDRFPVVRDECFKEYDRVSAEAGLTTLAARTGTVLVVGAVERSGVYLLDSVKAKGAKVTLLDVVLAAGASPDIKTYAVHGRIAPEATGPRGSPAGLLYNELALAFSDSIVIVSEDLAWSPQPEWYRLTVLGRSETPEPVLATFSAAAVRQWDRWTAFQREFNDRDRGPGFELDASVIQSPTRTLVTGAVDIREGFKLQRIVASVDPDIPVRTTLKELMPRIPSTTELATFRREMAAGREPRVPLRLRMYDRLAGSAEPILDLPLSDAMNSEAPVPDGAFINIRP